MSFIEDYKTAVKEKDSILCAGVDPAEFSMGRKSKGLPEGVDKTKWAIKYIHATSNRAAAIKPNLNYWENIGDMANLVLLVEAAHRNGQVAILDSKIADIGTTDEAGIFFTVMKHFDAITVAPYAGNMKEVADFGEKHDIGTITMCLMSSPDYKREKNKLVPILKVNGDYTDDFMRKDIQMVGKRPHVKQYKYIALNANKHGISAIVVGAPSASNHLQAYEVKKVAEYAGNDILILVPGIGAQGGELDFLAKHFERERMIANVGRGLMFANGANTTSYEHAKRAIEYADMFNKKTLK